MPTWRPWRLCRYGRLNPAPENVGAGIEDLPELQRFRGEALRHRLHHLGLNLRRVVEQASERAVGDHERAHRRRRDHGRSPRLTRDERDLAKKVARPKRVHSPAVLLDVRRPVEQDEELAARRSLARHLLALVEIDLVREQRDLLQLRPRAAREQRNLADKVDLLVSAQSHTASLKPIAPATRMHST